MDEQIDPPTRTRAWWPRTHTVLRVVFGVTLSVLVVVIVVRGFGGTESSDGGAYAEVSTDYASDPSADAGDAYSSEGDSDSAGESSDSGSGSASLAEITPDSYGGDPDGPNIQLTATDEVWCDKSDSALAWDEMPTFTMRWSIPDADSVSYSVDVFGEEYRNDVAPEGEETVNFVCPLPQMTFRVFATGQGGSTLAEITVPNHGYSEG